MDKIKKSIEKRFALMAVGFTALLTITAFENMGFEFVVADTVNMHIYEFLHGLRFGLMGVLLIFSIRYIFVLNDEKKLKKLYNQMSDERMALIRMKSGAPMLTGCALALLGASMAAMYLNTTVSLTLIGSALFLLIVAVVGKVYISMKI